MSAAADTGRSGFGRDNRPLHPQDLTLEHVERARISSMRLDVRGAASSEFELAVSTQSGHRAPDVRALSRAGLHAFFLLKRTMVLQLTSA